MGAESIPEGACRGACLGAWPGAGLRSSTEEERLRAEGAASRGAWRGLRVPGKVRTMEVIIP